MGSENNKTTWLDISPENCSTNSNVLPGQPLGPLLTVDLFRTASGTGSSCAIATFLPPGSDGRSPVGERPSGLRANFPFRPLATAPERRRGTPRRHRERIRAGQGSRQCGSRQLPDRPRGFSFDSMDWTFHCRSGLIVLDAHFRWVHASGSTAATGIFRTIAKRHAPHSIKERRRRRLPHLKLPEIDGTQCLQCNGHHADRVRGQVRRDGMRLARLPKSALRSCFLERTFDKATPKILPGSDKKLLFCSFWPSTVSRETERSRNVFQEAETKRGNLGACS